MIKRIGEATIDFPSGIFIMDIGIFILPVAQGFIDSDRTPFGIKQVVGPNFIRQS